MPKCVYLISLGDGWYYHHPDDQMNATGTLVVATQFPVGGGLEEALRTAQTVNGSVELWELDDNSYPVRHVE